MMSDTLNEKNTVIMQYARALSDMMANLYGTLSNLSDRDEINTGCIKTADIQITAINSQIVVLQSALDNYWKD